MFYQNRQILLAFQGNLTQNPLFWTDSQHFSHKSRVLICDINTPLLALVYRLPLTKFTAVDKELSNTLARHDNSCKIFLALLVYIGHAASHNIMMYWIIWQLYSQSQDIPLLVILMFCSEGDNAPDALRMIDFANSSLNVINNLVSDSARECLLSTSSIFSSLISWLMFSSLISAQRFLLQLWLKKCIGCSVDWQSLYLIRLSFFYVFFFSHGHR